jgi:tetratricopeptide (TPR) repeat protein
MMRPTPQRDDLLTLRRAAGDAPRLQLSGLADPAVAQLVAVLAGGTPDRHLLRLARDAAGNPLYITELVGALARASTLSITGDGKATIPADTAPRSLAAAIADRIDFISDPVREVLRSAALLGVDFDLADLATLQHRSIADLAKALQEACAAGVLVESGDRLQFRHPLIHAALYEGMPAPVRIAWHREAGRVLAGTGAPAVRVARQLLSAGEPGAEPMEMDEWMVGWLASASEVLVSQAPPVAAALLARAVDSTPIGSHRHRWLASRLASALYHLGENAAADHMAYRILEQAGDPDLLVDLLWTVTMCRTAAGRPADSLAVLGRALAVPGLTPRHRSRLLVLAARTHVSFGELEKAAKAALEALAIEEGGDAWTVGWASHVLAMAATLQGKLDEALSVYDQGLAVTQADPALADLRLLLQINQAAALGNLGQHEKALAAAGKAGRLADQVGTTVRQTQAHCLRAELLFGTGLWDDALAEMAIMPESLKQPSIACVELGLAALIAFHRGDAAAARSCLSASAPHVQRVGNRLIPTLALARSVDHEQAGALPEALSVLTDWLDSGTEELGHMQDLIADAARLALKCGKWDTAHVIAENATESARQMQTPYRRGNALYCRGLLQCDGTLLLTAAEHYRHAGRPLHQAMALEAAGSEFLLAHNPEQAKMTLADAAGIYAQLGATLDASRAMATANTKGA